MRIQQRCEIDGSELGTDVSGPAAIFAHVEVARGHVHYLRGDERIQAPASFAIYLPPFSIAQARLERCELLISGIAFRPRPGLALPARSVLAAVTRGGPLRLSEGIEIDREDNPLQPSGHAKKILDREYASPLTIAGVASRAGVAPAALTRSFQRAFGMPPVRYRHQLRVMDALLRLSDGAVPLDVCGDVGFEDLSRFYHVFRQIACGTPGTYRPARSKNAKTQRA